MTVTLAAKPKWAPLKEMRGGARELLVSCPKCKTLEILWFENGYLMQTRKFDQTDGQVYHDCGLNQPCRLYLSG
jgi:hypothetical protein